MLDQLRRLVSGSTTSNSGPTDGIPPSGNVRQSRNHGPPSGGSRSGSLSRLTAYALHPQHSGRVRMQLSYGVVPVSYGPPPPVVAYGRNGRPVVGYDPWYQVRYQQAHPPPRTPVGRQLSARPDLAPPPPPSNSSSGKKKSDKEQRIDVFHHPTLRRDTVVPNGRNRLVSSRSLDSIHPHRIYPAKEKANVEVEVKSSSKKVKDFFQRVRDSVSNGSSQSNRSGQGQRTDEWLLLRPSVADSSKPPPQPQQRPTTPGIAAFRKIFSRSPSPTPVATSTPVKKPLSSTKSLFQQIIRPRSRSVSSTASLSVRSQSTQSGGIRTKVAASTTDLNGIHPAGSTQRGNPDGATFPRDSPHPPPEFHEIYAPASEPARPTVILPSQNGQSKRPKFVKKVDQQPAFRVRRRQSQLRRSERKRRSSRRRSGRKKNRSKKLGSTKGSQLGSQSALSGAKLVSDWTYLPLPTSFTPAVVKEPVVSKEPESAHPSTSVVQDDGWESDLYQVLVDRPRRTLPPPMWDPLIFIPPERRRSTVVNGSSILSDSQPWIRSSKLRADGKKQLRRINPPLSPSSSRSASSGKPSYTSRNHCITRFICQHVPSKSCVAVARKFCFFLFNYFLTFIFLNWRCCLPAIYGLSLIRRDHRAPAFPKKGLWVANRIVVLIARWSRESKNFSLLGQNDSLNTGRDVVNEQ